MILPPLVLVIGWRGALLAELVPVFLLIASMELPRHRWDADRDPGVRPWGRTLLQPFLLLRDKRILRLSASCFIYSGLQLCFVAFMTEHLTTVVGLDLIHAGQMLAAYQIAGSISRPVWGWVADRCLTPMRTLGVLGVGMAIAAALAGQFSPAWRAIEILAAVLLAGCTAGGYRRGLCGIRGSGRHPPDRGNRSGDRPDVFRRIADPAVVWGLDHAVGRLRSDLPGDRSSGAGQ